MGRALRSLLVSFEAVPFAKVGGLGDVAGALPDALGRLGDDCRLVLPRFGDIDGDRFGLETVDIPADWFVGVDFRHHPFTVHQGRLPGGAPVWLIGDDTHFGRPGIYNDPGGAPFADELERLVFFCKAVVELLKCRQDEVDVVHLNDYHTALVAPYMRRLYAAEPVLSRPAICFSIHNLAYQGVFARERLATMGFEPDICAWPSPFEFHGAVNLMKLGIEFADVVNTVSPGYAEEIRGAEQGAGLDGLLRACGGKLSGILNGIDVDVWNPETDPKIPYRFRPGKMSGKRGCKGALLSRAGLSLDLLDRPLVGMVGRLVEQKGLDIVLEAAEEILARDVALVVLGSGARHIEDALADLAHRRSDRVGVRIGFDDALAHLITAGSDFFLMPSRYEPCGLNQMYAQRYGTLPIVHATGGLADTVFEWDPELRTGTGFLFDRPQADRLVAALDRALRAWREPKSRARLTANAMACDFSWTRSAQAYHALYEDAIDRRNEARAALA